MKILKFVCTIALLMLAVSFGSHTIDANADAADLAPLFADSSAELLPNQYIVVYKNTRMVESLGVEHLAEAAVNKYGGTLLQTYAHALQGFAAELSPEAIDELRRDKNVDFVEQDMVAHGYGTQNNPPSWGLDRIDQRNLPLNNKYIYQNRAGRVDVYILDTGVRSSHNDFGGRVVGGATAINDGNGYQDCDGHGTHVAGTVAGNAYGVAKRAKIYAVRVLNCSGSGSYSGIIAGVDWVTQVARGPSVANMSLGGGASNALDNAIRNSISSGVVYVVAAGNSNANACNYSPARINEAITVGSTTSSDARSSFSNKGSCVDIFAPGSSIKSTWYTSNNATATLSGTSMASPHVAGCAAVYLHKYTSASPATVANAIINKASNGKISNVGSGSPNKLLYCRGF